MARNPRELAEGQFSHPAASSGGVDLVVKYATDVPLVVEGLLGALAPERSDGTILEMGFGTGWLLEMLAERFPSAQLYGLDLSPAMVEAVAKKVPMATICCGDMEASPFDDGQFDRVASCCALYFAHDIEAALVELRRVTARRGKVVVNTVSPDNLKEMDAFSREVLRATPLEDVTRRFDMETGYLPMKKHFPGAERVEWRGEMVLPDVASFMAYWSSFHHREIASEGQALLDRATRIAERLSDHDGRIRITRASGAFIGAT
jgi:ubiquinone/menaquinone biosynthesis C-methylase UbiE